MFMGRIVIDNRVQVEVFGRAGVNVFQELNSLLVARPRHAGRNHQPLQHVQGGNSVVVP
jgi:hypothetical protein